jgi:hypothetical protein
MNMKTEFDFRQLSIDVEYAIKHVGNDFQRTPSLILTESDLKCLLYKKLTELPSFDGLQETLNPYIRTNKERK